jgi:hypothetical protein
MNPLHCKDYLHGQWTNNMLGTAQFAGHIRNVAMLNFMGESNYKSILLSTIGKHVTVLQFPFCEDMSVLFLAVRIGLGAKTKDLQPNRTNLHQFLSHDKSTTIQICLWNCGLGAFQPEKYGSQIIVERVISPTGSNALRLLNSEGRMVCCGERNLERVLENFNIKLDNPLTFLDKTTFSRCFLHGDQRELYQFFVKAANMGKDDKNLAMIVEELQKLRASRAAFQTIRSSKEAEASRLDKKLEEIKSAAMLKEGTTLPMLKLKLGLSLYQRYEEDCQVHCKVRNEL